MGIKTPKEKTYREEEKDKMQNKLKALQAKLEIRQAEKKGAASIETIIVSALLIALAVGLVTAFSKTLGDSGSASNKATATAVNKAVTQAGTNQTQTSGSVTVAP